MRKGQQATLSAFLAAAIGATASAVIWPDRSGLIAAAQAQSDEEKKKKKREQERPRAAPPRPQPPPPPRVQSPPPRPQPPPAAKTFQPPPARPAQQFQQPPAAKPSFAPRPGGSPPPDRPAKTFQPPAAKPSFAPRPGGSPPPDRPAKSFQPQQLPPTKPAQQFAPPPSTKPLPSKPATAPPVELKKEGIKRFPPPSREGGVPPPKGAPSFERPPAAIAKPPSGPSDPGTAGPVSPRPFVPSKLKRFDDIQKDRRERVEDGGRRKLIEEPGNRLIVKENNRAIIRHDEAERFLRRPGARSERRADGTVETFYIRRDGVRIFTVVDANGRLLRRFRRDRDGREHNYIDNRRFYRNVGIGLGIGALIALNLRPPRVTIPYDSYILDYDDADDDDLYETLDAPLVDDIDRAYSLEEIRYNYELRARVRSIDLTSITFEFGSWEVAPDQYGRLERMARAILRVLRDNSDAVILIEGHTDAPGDEDYNLSLGDRRAQAVAEILTETFEVPPENLVTQGYGEQYLKVDTQEPEPRNRRVTFRNITGLMAER